MGDVYEEVDNLLSQRGIKTRMAKPVTRHYAFEEKGVPTEAEFLKIKYPASAWHSLYLLSKHTHASAHTHSPSLAHFLSRNCGCCCVGPPSPQAMDS